MYYYQKAMQTNPFYDQIYIHLGSLYGESDKI